MSEKMNSPAITPEMVGYIKEREWEKEEKELTW